MPELEDIKKKGIAGEVDDFVIYKPTHSQVLEDKLSVTEYLSELVMKEKAKSFVEGQQNILKTLEEKMPEEKPIKKLTTHEQTWYHTRGYNQAMEEVKAMLRSLQGKEDYSHTCCDKQNQPSACGIPLEKHKQCCLCERSLQGKGK